jgi:hypothetical protein
MDAGMGRRDDLTPQGVDIFVFYKLVHGMLLPVSWDEPFKGPDDPTFREGYCKGNAMQPEMDRNLAGNGDRNRNPPGGEPQIRERIDSGMNRRGEKGPIKYGDRSD